VRETMTYRDAGVDIEAAEKTLKSVKGAIKATHSSAVISSLANFGGMIALGADSRT